MTLLIEPRATDRLVDAALSDPSLDATDDIERDATEPRAPRYLGDLLDDLEPRIFGEPHELRPDAWPSTRREARHHLFGPGHRRLEPERRPVRFERGEDAARAEDARSLEDHRCGIIDVHQDALGATAVDRAVRKRQSSADRSHQCPNTAALAHGPEHHDAGIDADGCKTLGSEELEVMPGAAADVDHHRTGRVLRDAMRHVSLHGAESDSRRVEKRDERRWISARIDRRVGGL
ncbi:MAG TPA: hypothetical protein VEA78_08430 [Acidimicrobiales bacterium]|nr:hypothetical protein [Acidimicrobiales bacterium]